ncbi:hypothetical protein GOODEAATRI_003766 [Goodea atripinnis]|uniref:Uncharacterized protein n=1 Tax=Goodea atripinnis TaxID=208336 RepID=A0ABV0NH87_9TELE
MCLNRHGQQGKEAQKHKDNVSNPSFLIARQDTSLFLNFVKLASANSNVNSGLLHFLSTKGTGFGSTSLILLKQFLNHPQGLPKVRRPICTSGPLRASTRVSSGFALPRHSSPSFGSDHTRSCSTSPTVRARQAGGAPGPQGARDPTSASACRPSLSLRHGVSSSPLTRVRVRLLGPCFKTGRVGSQHRR